ncbi:uncharacterized protein TNCT_406041 [Trichonephila clavata]|uniref:Uncharacterized protein n=1 Tax=Trichonephila clavata TaxID=2740835 RepID=A0A8X6LGD2_TRICU|nr:uncharacterized protein TNCT_406041 [Trichonephila clavata]
MSCNSSSPAHNMGGFTCLLGRNLDAKESDLLVFSAGEGNQQYFRVKPKDTDIIEGHSSDLQCHIGNQAGAVQWSKDGFVLDAHQIHLTPSSLILRSRSGEDLRVTIPDALIRKMSMYRW